MLADFLFVQRKHETANPRAVLTLIYEFCVLQEMVIEAQLRLLGSKKSRCAGSGVVLRFASLLNPNSPFGAIHLFCGMEPFLRFRFEFRRVGGIVCIYEYRYSIIYTYMLFPNSDKLGVLHG